MTEATQDRLVKGEMDPDTVLRQVRKLIALAEAEIAPGATEQERAATERQQKAALAKADALMLAYSIKESVARNSLPESERVKPGIITIDVTDIADPLKDQLSQLVWVLQDYTRTSVVMYGLRSRVTKEMQRYYASSGVTIPRVTMKVYGFQAELRYFELLWTTLTLHLYGGINLDWDSRESIEDNAYRLHNAGYNWLDMARMYPDNTWPANGEPATQAGSRMKRAYQRACRARGEATVTIPASGRVTFRRSYVQAFTNKISSRFAELSSRREPGTDVMLRSDFREVQDMFQKDNDGIKEHKAKRTGYSPDGYRRGRARAETADLQGKRVGESATRAVNAS